MKIPMLFATLVMCSAANANIYRYTDEHGRVFLSNSPPAILPVKLSHAKKKSYNKNQILRIASKFAKKYGVEEALVHAVINTESAFKTDAISRVGAAGLMQLMPATATRFGVNDRYDPIQNIEGGVKYLKYLLTLFNNNKKLALAGYNAGEHAVIRRNNKIPPYPETKNYVVSVMSYYLQLRT